MAERLTIGAPPAADLGDLPPRPALDDDQAVTAGAGPEGDVPELLAEPMVRSLLESCAFLAGMVANPVHVKGLWRFEPGELDMLTPAVTRIANRTPALRAALIQGDWITVALVMGGYTARNVNTWREASAELERQGAAGHGGPGSGAVGTPGFGGGHPAGAAVRDDLAVRQAGLR